MDMLSPLLAIEPPPGLDHPQPQCLTSERDTMGPRVRYAFNNCTPDGARAPEPAPPPPSQPLPDAYRATPAEPSP